MSGEAVERVALHVMRAWRTPDGLLWVRVMSTTDVTADEVAAAVVTTREQVLASAEAWLRAIAEGGAPGVTPR
ncbi:MULTISPECIES: hypothetical protein [Amycolatopsis]|uniref:Uncharacterized protein n=2 Tax=Amycolatopsis TaxID=1813 RepID=A0A2A9FH39_9PSEU|nr:MULTISPECIES: hypothetical protein [Amycolatopsis]PFG50684.1 hypothetical protein ATK36_5929 [Amycolatopsis sulphurea]RJQ84798.1 hypothetical protein D5S19_16170 [Amycolatopsis panacis]